MKTFAKVLSILLFIIGIITVVSIINYKDMLNNEFINHIINVSTENILPIIAITICFYCLDKNNTDYMARIIPLYLIVPIILSIFIEFFGIKEGLSVDIHNFLSCTYLEIVGFSLINSVSPNNMVTTVVKYIATLLCGITLVFHLILYFNIGISNIYSFYSSLNNNLENVIVYLGLTVGQIFTIIILYISNYGFGDKDEESATSIDFEEVKQKAENLANAQMNNIYDLSPKNEEPDRSLSENGLMNINNQLGQNSNVGTVKEQAKGINVQGSTLDSLMPLSKGPVVNNTIQEKPKTVETIPPQVQETLPPNLDIQEQMKLKAEANQNNINQ